MDGWKDGWMDGWNFFQQVRRRCFLGLISRHVYMDTTIYSYHTFRMNCIYYIYKSGKRVFVCLSHTPDTCGLACNLMDVLSLFAIFMYLILMKAQQERAFLCLLLQLRRRRM